MSKGSSELQNTFLCYSTFSGACRAYCKGADIFDKVRAKGSEEVHLVIAILQMKSPEIPVSSLMMQESEGSQLLLHEPQHCSPQTKGVACFVVLVVCERPQFSLSYHIHSPFLCCFVLFFSFSICSPDCLDALMLEKEHR